MPGPETAGGATGPARRTIEANGTDVTVIDEYKQFAEEGEFGSELYDTRYFERAETAAILNRADAYARDYLTRGAVLSGENLGFFTPAGPDGEPAIRETGGSDVPEDEQLPGGPDPSRDEYGPSYVFDVTNARYFDVISVITEPSGVRRASLSLRDGGIEVEPRPE